MTVRRGGFTIVELLIVLSILAVLASIAVPSYRHVVRNVQAVKIAAELRTVTMAAYDTYITTGHWPADTEPGVVPPEISARAPGIRFRGPGYLIDWENGTDGETTVRGAAVILEEPRMEAAVLARMPSQPAENATPSSRTRGRPFLEAGGR